MDAGDYAASWKQAAALFKEAADGGAVGGRRPQRRAARSARVLSRSVTSARYRTSLPGAPDGEYVIIQYATSFENKKARIETVTPMKDTDGVWRVSGYFVN